MHMVGHEHEAVNLDLMGEAGLKKLIEVDDVVTLSVEAGLPVIASLNDMARRICKKISGLARHLQGLSRQRYISKCRHRMLLLPIFDQTTPTPLISDPFDLFVILLF